MRLGQVLDRFIKKALSHCVGWSQQMCSLIQNMLHFDGILGDRTDPLMQDWVALDNQINSRLFASNSAHSVSEQIKLLRDQYMSLRVTIFDYVASLNDQILFQHSPGPKA